jgi:hypothetical protein
MWLALEKKSVRALLRSNSYIYALFGALYGLLCSPPVWEWIFQLPTKVSGDGFI